jgi:hypothetical protein
MMNRNAERMQYQPDKLSYWLCILSIVFNAVYFVGLYTNRSVAPDVTIGIDILTNIVFMMIVFLGSEKLKAYEKKWNMNVMIVGAFQILRIFWVPMHFNRLEMLIEGRYTLAVISLLLSGILLLIAGINSSINLGILSRFDESGVGE